ncbi:MAG TPA: nitrate reductase molybdenum cofactor assembly chaperone [Xanthobacteraceae bacterium]|jgi:nitrate reductase delta subunit|nr:nitrate reductase molybdenum cofactor assembly chaperone [Xanthobacteraceae bacterium]
MDKTFKALSVLLNYPTDELAAATGEISEVLENDARIPAPIKQRLHKLVAELTSDDRYDLQERYVLLFDRTRSLSLHLFEHVHGEGRNRGQAMIDLMQMYDRHGLEIDARELPDFIPIFLEYVALLPEAEARELLAQPAHIFAALAERLRKRSSRYEAVFRALVALATVELDEEVISTLLEMPDPDAGDLKALDAAWEDQPVDFGLGANGCKDEIVAKVRAGRRPAPGVETKSHRPVITRS